MMPNTIVVAPTTAVPINTGLAVALNVLPVSPAFSNWVLAPFEIRRKPEVPFNFRPHVGYSLNLAQFVNRLRVVRNRAEAIDRDSHRSHAQKSKSHQAESKIGPSNPGINATSEALVDTL